MAANVKSSAEDFVEVSVGNIVLEVENDVRSPDSQVYRREEPRLTILQVDEVQTPLHIRSVENKEYFAGVSLSKSLPARCWVHDSGQAGVQEGRCCQRRQ